ncbi:MAG: phosphatidylserine decarboxylase family protein [Deltaproteobacteria bacterium]|nr:phosphatidylserine decarboxylase family protein [Deltaproteobacteria bacterium]MBN2687892.1 phosphatidylserine decarboxylase family protein [Deltaproteobacteria bacterium]
MDFRESPVVLEGFVFIAPLCALTLVFAYFGNIWTSVLFFCATLFVANFFRNPERSVPQDEKAILSPADGRVLSIEEGVVSSLIEGPCKKVSIFMNVFNVHVNRMPFSGTVTAIEYRPGKFFSANLDKASELNERNSVVVTTDDGRKILTVQIAGMVARRIVCWVNEGMEMARGERFGLIRFGSRLEVFMPSDTEISVTVGEKVKAGETIVGRLS